MVNIGICDDDKYTVAELERLIYDIATEKRLKVEVEVYYDGSSIHWVSKSEATLVGH